jgi:TonB family protein
VPAASSVFGAARALRSVVSDADSAATATYLDSLHSSIHGLGDSLGRAPLPSSSFFADTGAAHRMELLATLLRSQLGHTPTAAALVAEFAMADGRALRDSIDMAGVVRGLVRDSTGPGRESVARRPAASRRRRPDNSALALKFRDSQSIKDSIGKHTPNLQALYKRELKRHAGMSGTVYVTFRVAPSGKVLSATIKSTQIEEKDFLVPFIEYAGTMRFKPIPEHVGPMTFEFPFSFTPKS